MKKATTVSSRAIHIGLSSLAPLLLIASAAQATIDPPSGPPFSGDGNYTINYDADTGSNYCAINLDERLIGSTGWTYIYDSDGDGSVAFQSKPIGVYEYRVYADCEDYYGEESWVEISSSITVQVGPTPSVDPLSVQLEYSFQAQIGDLNADGLQDVFVSRTLGGESGNGVLENVLLTQISAGKFASSSPPEALASSLSSTWPAANIDISLRDINADDFVDLVLFGIDNYVVGANTEIVFSSGAVFVSDPAGQFTIDADAKKMIGELRQWYADNSYFDDNAVWVEEPGHWETTYECEWEYTPYEGFELVCDTYVDWVDGEEYWDYSAFEPKSIDVAEAVKGILNGGVNVIEDVLDIFSIILDVPTGGSDCSELSIVAMTSDECREHEAGTILFSLFYAENEEPEQYAAGNTYIAVRGALGISLAGHSVIIHVPMSGPAEWYSANWNFSNPNDPNSGKVLVGVYKDPRDAPYRVTPIGTVTGMITPAWTSLALAAMEGSYCDCAPYAAAPGLTPGLDYNSNGYTHGLINRIGGLFQPDGLWLSPGLKMPGWNDPLPNGYFIGQLP